MRKKSSSKFHFILQKTSFDYQSLKADSVKTLYHIASKKKDNESLGI